MLTLDAEAAGKVLFDQTFNGTLPLLPNWEDQPEVFRNLMKKRALRIAQAAVHMSEGPDPQPVGDPPPDPSPDPDPDPA